MFSLRFYVSRYQWKKHYVAKILHGIWEVFLYENNRNCNFYKFSHKFAFTPRLSFRRNQKQKSNIQQVTKSAEAICVEIATEMKKCFRLKDMLNFNVFWNF